MRDMSMLAFLAQQGAQTGVDGGAFSQTIFGSLNNLSTYAVLYVHPAAGSGSTSSFSFPFLRAGTVKSFRLLPYSNTLNSSTVCTVQKDGTDTSISVTIGAGSTATVTDDDSVSFNADEGFTLKCDISTSSSGSLFLVYGFLYEPSN